MKWTKATSNVTLIVVLACFVTVCSCARERTAKRVAVHTATIRSLHSALSVDLVLASQRRISEASMQQCITNSINDFSSRYLMSEDGLQFLDVSVNTNLWLASLDTNARTITRVSKRPLLYLGFRNEENEMVLLALFVDGTIVKTETVTGAERLWRAFNKVR